MINFYHIKNDYRQIIREPIMLLLFILPIFISVIFKLILTFCIPILHNYFDFTLDPYYSYIISLTFLLIPGMLGAVTGFMMLDEKDGKISELLSITPLGKIGYLINRLSFGFIASFIYTLITYYILSIYTIPILTLLFIAILLGIYAFIIGSILFMLSDDKVKGLTYAKGLNIIMLFALSDLLNIKWLSILSMFFPTYWITKVIQNPNNLIELSSALLVHGIWLFILLLKDR
ncbi:hypothetical protein [Oceanirhabdus sp. W0125-5]|uniref:hypothetical protein n=1 Tax=Oceanirhabdus sp. W0125-5 TaxID=2999116 RepID=UPI0022F34006|nr:hypothetical protein [Oceanirhabdus sp. W0125-5]WBW95662.1 hypothetical protein OW730_18460 [Oceanirhabdus sp. W0125-5]